MTPVPHQLRGASKDVKERNPHVFGDSGEKSDDGRPVEAYPGLESAFQSQAEHYLTAKGYRQRRSRVIMDSRDTKWQIHIPRATGNPIILDLLLLDEDTGRYLEIELKTAKGSVSSLQRVILGRKGAIAWNMQELRDIVEAWEAESS